MIINRRQFLALMKKKKKVNKGRCIICGKRLRSTTHHIFYCDCGLDYAMTNEGLNMRVDGDYILVRRMRVKDEDL